MTKAPEDKLTEMPVLPSIFPTSPRQSNPISTQESESSFRISSYLCREKKTFTQSKPGWRRTYRGKGMCGNKQIPKEKKSKMESEASGWMWLFSEGTGITVTQEGKY